MVQASSLEKVIFVVGATASGKSAVSVELAKRFDAEIISADSMQIYRGMDIGTGKITLDEQQGVRHHLIDIVEPNEDFSVGEYVSRAYKVIDELCRCGKKIIVTGGTGLYVNALINGMNFANAPCDYELRDKLKNIAKEKGNDYLHDKLKKIDAVSAEKIAINDVKRIVRAIEIYELTGKRKSDSVKTSPKIPYRLFALSLPREELYSRIERRVDGMFNSGLIDEVKSLYVYKDCKSMQAIGYKEIIDGLQNDENVAEIIERVKLNSRRYAKRQLTYFRNMSANVEWVERDFVENILNLI